MAKTINWGIISTAKIAVEHLIPALQSCPDSKVIAIASRSMKKAQTVAKDFGIPNAYGSYHALLQNPDIDAIYNPLPNDQHIAVSLQAAQAGKHILCEKPVAMNEKEARQLANLPPDICFMEAFMVRFHLQWQEVRKIVRSGELGEVKAVQTFFSYYNRNPANIRNIPETGGGAMLDIGCYANVTAKYIFEQAPKQVVALSDDDPEFHTDRLMSGIFDFGAGRHLTFSVSTQLVKYQRVNILGTRARLEVLIPFNAPSDEATRLIYDNGTHLDGSSAKTIEIPACNQYRLQCETFNRTIREEEELPYSVQDAIENMHIIDAVFRSAQSATWQPIKSN